MKTYSVTLPVTGIIYVDDIQADSEEEAIEKALEQPHSDKDISEWDVHRIIVQGNVFHGHANKASADEQ